MRKRKEQFSFGTILSLKSIGNYNAFFREKLTIIYGISRLLAKNGVCMMAVIIGLLPSIQTATRVN